MLLRAFLTLTILILVLYRIRKDRFTRYNRENLGLLAIAALLNGSALSRESALATVLGFVSALLVLIFYGTAVYLKRNKPNG